MNEFKKNQAVIDHISKWHSSLMIMAAVLGPIWWFFERWAAPGVFFPLWLKIASVGMFLLTAFLCRVPRLSPYADWMGLFTGTAWASLAVYLVFRNGVHPYFVMISAISVASGPSCYKNRISSGIFVLWGVLFAGAMLTWHWVYHPLPYMSLFFAAHVTMSLISFGGAVKQHDIERELEKSQRSLELKNQFVEKVALSISEIVCVIKIDRFEVTYLNQKDSIDKMSHCIERVYLASPSSSVFQMNLPSGELVWLDVRWTDFQKNQKGEVTHKIGVIRDITGQKLQEEENERQRLIMIESSRLSALGEVASGIGHEINNPLMIISGVAENLEEALDFESDVDLGLLKSHAKRIRKMATRIAEIVKGLKHLSRDASGDPLASVDVGEIIQESIDLVRYRFERAGVALRFNIPITKREVIGRGVQISQILVNLLGNSLEAVKDQRDAWVEVLVTESNSMVQIRVRDSGPRISKSIQENMMKPFFTTKAVGVGTGLGLSISAALAKSQGGRLVFETDDPTTFLIEFLISQVERKSSIASEAVLQREGRVTDLGRTTVAQDSTT